MWNLVSQSQLFLHRSYTCSPGRCSKENFGPSLRGSGSNGPPLPIHCQVWSTSPLQQLVASSQRLAPPQSSCSYFSSSQSDLTQWPVVFYFQWLCFNHGQAHLEHDISACIACSLSFCLSLLLLLCFSLISLHSF